LKGLVIDLRDNPGGLLNAAVGVSDLFLEEVSVVQTKGRHPNANLDLKAKAGDVLQGAPIVVVINAGTASAAEIVAGALQDHQRGLVVGQASFGKGSVQSILPLDNGDGIKLTTARYYTPKGVSIQNNGILPDVALRDYELRMRPVGARPVTEANLAGHLDEVAPRTDANDTGLLSQAARSAVDQSWQNDYAARPGGRGCA
jgi:carboxyl-terminal processing protease